MRLSLTYIALIALALTLASCGSRKGLGALDLNHIYQKDGTLVRPRIRIYNTDQFNSKVYFSFSSEEILYSRLRADEPFEASVDVQIFVYEDFSLGSIIDTFSTSISESTMELTPHTIYGEVDVAIHEMRPLEQYVLLIRFNDRNRKLYFDAIQLLERSNPLSRQNYLVLDADSNVVFGDHILLNRDYRVLANTDDKQLHVRYYNREFNPGLPPFAKPGEGNFDHTADSTFRVSNGERFQVHEQGFYHFQTDPSVRDGFTLYNFYDTYPLVTDKKHLIYPMRYLTSNLEYDGINLNDEDSAKYAIDKFWLTHASNEERARDQIEEYYERVEAANVYFTSYKEGWMTDRGVLYVIYGPPQKIYRTLNTEIWVYGEETSSLNFTFAFDRMVNPYTGNDYSLRRSSEYRYGWGMAIDAWRHGRIYDVSDIKKAQDERDQQLRQTAAPHIWY
ncbi:MAG: GWxTD domain-containing protein [Bacteroidetes bacterium]|nr:MAG: GWxTD domain-containing protein [Bacteroidota bacterium]